jgi:hypothetical protein
MNIFKNIPIDIVLHILSYDNKTIKNGKIVNIVNKLERIKYQNIIHLLENKPKIYYNSFLISSPFVILQAKEYQIFYSLKYDKYLHEYTFSREHVNN